jgi:16S rRNA (adenine1518-N6/adenine1519-N6)-dimethyltransferase
VQDLARIKHLLAARGLRPQHRFGQNFLHEPIRIERLVDAAEIVAGDLVLEVGPGTGALTEVLLERGARVVACELDRGLADLIEEEVLPHADGRLTLVRGDCLARGRRLAPEIDAVLAGEDFRLVANLPYQCASPLMAELAMNRPDCLGQFVTIQREVGDRLATAAGTDGYGTLSVIVQAVATARRLEVLPPGCFWPQPKVTSATVAVRPLADADVPAPLRASLGHGGRESREAFARFVTSLFSKRRKQLGSTLGRDRTWPDGIDPTDRCEQLTPAQFAALWASVEGDDAAAGAADA